MVQRIHHRTPAASRPGVLRHVVCWCCNLATIFANPISSLNSYLGVLSGLVLLVDGSLYVCCVGSFQLSFKILFFCNFKICCIFFILKQVPIIRGTEGQIIFHDARRPILVQPCRFQLLHVQKSNRYVYLHSMYKILNWHRKAYHTPSLVPKITDIF